FFFNTLNNIYSLSLEKSDKTPETIVKLSDLMRYVLYETGGKNQCLRKEFEFINNYLYMEKIRYNSNLELNFKVTGNLKCKKITPLRWVQCNKNAFQHGDSMSLG